jgi:hypothetical protein
MPASSMANPVPSGQQVFGWVFGWVEDFPWLPPVPKICVSLMTGVYPYALDASRLRVCRNFAICPLLNNVEVLYMQDGSKFLGLQFGVVRLCSGAVL